MSASDNDSDVSEDGISLKIDSKGSKDFNVCDSIKDVIACCQISLVLQVLLSVILRQSGFNFLETLQALLVTDI